MQIGEKITYTTDENGNVTSITHIDGNVEIYTENFAYDTEGNISEQSVTIPTV